MPRYVYQCSNGHGPFEVEKSVSLAGQNEPCPQCGALGSRVFTAPAISTGASCESGACGPEPSAGCQGCCQSGACGLDD